MPDFRMECRSCFISCAEKRLLPSARRIRDDCHCAWAGQCPRCGYIDLGWAMNPSIEAGKFRGEISLKRRTCSKCRTQYKVKRSNMQYARFSPMLVLRDRPQESVLPQHRGGTGSCFI